MDLKNFSQKLKSYLKAAGYTQKALAIELNLDPTVLNHKLRGTGRTALTHSEIHKIVEILAKLKVLTKQSEVSELLALANCPNFTPEKWQMPPLNLLKQDNIRNLEIFTEFEQPKQVSTPNNANPAKYNLPGQLTSFVGRQAEVYRLKHMLNSTQLLTLIGSGGVGKTRLALEIANQVWGNFKDGVSLIELAALSDSQILSQQLVSSLGLIEVPGQNHLQVLFNYLQTRQILLILDNCEHLIQACAELVLDLQRNCPNLHILATSREPLRIDGETIYRLQPLSFPDLAQDTSPQSLLEYEAVQLFLERAAKAQSSFRINSSNAFTVAQLCYHLDGLPLAIELAAARLRSLSLRQIANLLDKRFELLTAGNRTEPPRHQTLKAVIDWSYELLSTKEQWLFQRLCIFAQGWQLEAAQAIASGEQLGIKQSEVLELLLNLVDKSMLSVEPAFEESRWGLAENLRQYGLEKLAEQDRLDFFKEHYLAYFLDLARQARPNLLGPQQTEWLHRLETEHENLRQALQWTLASDQPSPSRLRLHKGVELAVNLTPFWERRGYLSEGRKWLGLALRQLDNTTPPLLQAEVLAGAALLAVRQSDFTNAKELANRSLLAYQKLKNKAGLAWSHQILGLATQGLGEFKAAQEYYQHSLHLYQQLGEEWGSGLSLLNLGVLYVLQNNPAQAQHHLEQSIKLNQKAGDLRHVARSLYVMGGLLIRLGDKTKEAIGQLKRSLTLFNQLEDKYSLCQGLEILGWAVGMQGQLTEASTLLGAAQTSREQLSIPVPPGFQPMYQGFIAELRQKLGEAGFNSAWRAGQALSLAQALTFSLQA